MSEARAIDLVVDTDRYPLTDPTSAAWRSAVSAAQAELRGEGCSVLPDFIRPELLESLRKECAEVAPLAHYDVELVNAYNTPIDADLPDDHPASLILERGNAFVARDRIPDESIISRLYTNGLFTRFVAECFELAELHEYADPFGGLVLNVVSPSMAHPWHFDTNEFTVSMLTQEAESGGIFEYCPNIRSAQAENFADVRSVLTGGGDHLIRRLALRPGDLQLFKGRFSLHRVTTVDGQDARHSAIFAYSKQPGVIGNVERTRQLFGRVHPKHLAAAGQAVRDDQLLD